jgi:hypothetical protein
MHGEAFRAQAHERFLLLESQLEFVLVVDVDEDVPDPVVGALERHPRVVTVTRVDLERPKHHDLSGLRHHHPCMELLDEEEAYYYK